MIWAPFLAASSAIFKVFFRFSSGVGKTFACNSPNLISLELPPLFISSALYCDTSCSLHDMGAALRVRNGFLHFICKQLPDKSPQRFIRGTVSFVINKVLQIVE